MPFDISIFQEAVKAIEEEKADTFTSLIGSSDALLFSMLSSPSLLLCPSEERANELHSDVLFWSKLCGTDPPVVIQPEGSPGRLKSIADLYTSHKGKVIASVDAALSTLWRNEEFPLTGLSKAECVERDEVIRELYAMGYLNVPVVSGTGEISIRGGILDIFPPDMEFPVRVEFFGDEIESLRFFDVDTQLSVKEIEEIWICPVIEPEKGPDLINLMPESRLILSEPDDIRRRHPEIDELFEGKKIISFRSLPLEGEGFNCSINSPAGLGLLRDERKSVEGLVKRVNELRRNAFIMMVCSSEGQAHRLKDLFIEQNSDITILSSDNVLKEIRGTAITIGELSRGFTYQETIVLAGADIFGMRPAFKPIRKSRVSKLISSIEDFKKGDYLVHIEHGIGKYLGIKKERIEWHEDDFITIEYLGGDKLFVPLERINYVQKYHAPEGITPKIDRLGSKTWQRTRQKVKNKIKDMAGKLLKIYARRTAASGNAFSADTELHREFDGFFPYEETPDQLSSINEIKRDMEQPVPMDRLLCGDVGYGKTEVIMRACFKAVYDSKQAAVLVPTTILAEQHYETFVSRFSAFPIKIDFLSRFKSTAELKQTLKSLAEGGVDIIIGTHRLLGKDVSFFNLGLLVIDEEHKFGVAHKEKMKALKSNVDILSLSATPIPRTLHMALSGIRGMSTIETPPEDRLAVKSKVSRFNPTIIREALQHEIDRGGQAFFVHNRIHDIYEIGSFLSGLVPGARIGVAHGQMNGKELEQVMHKFFHREINILVSTAIIGSGLDIPSANTIIINRADRFGLADLYQLRGRVGRSNVRAYAYFLIPGEDIISEQAGKKLQAIKEMGYLGAGFRLALKDLEIRGAGNLLGAEQSGHIGAVGFDMYMEMLESAVSELKGEKRVPEIESSIELKVTAIISEEYIEDPDIRMSIYRKVASAKEIESLKKILDELKDRFGPLPEETKRLIEIMEIKIMAMKLFITKIENIDGRIRILFATGTPVSSEKIFSLYNTRKGYLKFLPEGGIELDMRGKKWETVFWELKEVMKELGVHNNA
ncbi:transcription-repair-coupling factor [bacterium BMS3Abin06]|nr:transcription-repair-coupling factor [bacterium BMS3Abin06]HDZ01214.1 transcription-repair coupling factor [Nitrospirota bacterium]